MSPGSASPGSASPPDGISIRAAVEADLPDCERIWRDGLNDYLRRLNQLEIPPENPGLRRLHAHTLATDPDRFAVAERDGRVLAFGSAVRRADVGFLSMLFVDPSDQARGVGRTLLERILPAGAASILGTVTDSLQPISNGLYASLGIVPRMPLFNLVGRPRVGWTPGPLPAGVTIEELATTGGGDTAAPGTVAFRAGVAAEVAALDREVVGYEHPADHAFMLHERPTVFGYRAADGSLAGYGYTSPVGRIGPVAVRDPELLAPVVAHLLTAVEPRGASAIWLPGGAGGAVTMSLDAGLRFEDFPLLLCWSRPFADFGRYIPISPGLP
ncbi:MAG: GNAT family N-acetyltransferase [Chloroflexi bacterium]|nr:GNAT family N-acetyltransferase [Chloroflexota bacterium]